MILLRSDKIGYRRYVVAVPAAYTGKELAETELLRGFARAGARIFFAAARAWLSSVKDKAGG